MTDNHSVAVGSAEDGLLSNVMMVDTGVGYSIERQALFPLHQLSRPLVSWWWLSCCVRLIPDWHPCVMIKSCIMDKRRIILDPCISFTNWCESRWNMGNYFCDDGNHMHELDACSDCQFVIMFIDGEDFVYHLCAGEFCVLLEAKYWSVTQSTSG